MTLADKFELEVAPPPRLPDHLIVAQLMLAVDYCHKKNIANRDIKLENMLLEANPRPNAKPLLKLCGACMRCCSLATLLRGHCFFISRCRAQTLASA